MLLRHDRDVGVFLCHPTHQVDGLLSSNQALLRRMDSLQQLGYVLVFLLVLLIFLTLLL